MLGVLYVVPTPIGNMLDITQRAIEILQNVQLIAAEDTRHSGQLLQKLEVTTPTISLHDHNEAQRAELLIDKLKNGASIALISDAGTPLISDPGYKLVSECRAAGIAVSSLPGACAVTTALSASGLPTDKFTFSGFLPAKQKAKIEAITGAIHNACTTIFYDSPRRILDTINICESVLPTDHKLVLAKELTKRFETYITGKASDALEYLNKEPSNQKGEFVLMIYCKPPNKDDLPVDATNLLMKLSTHLAPKKAASIVSEHFSLNKKALYEFVIKNKVQG